MIITVVTPETCVFFFFSLKPLVGPKVSTDRTDNNRRVSLRNKISIDPACFRHSTDPNDRFSNRKLWFGTARSQVALHVTPFYFVSWC